MELIKDKYYVVLYKGEEKIGKYISENMYAPEVHLIISDTPLDGRNPEHTTAYLMFVPTEHILREAK